MRTSTTTTSQSIHSPSPSWPTHTQVEAPSKSIYIYLYNNTMGIFNSMCNELSMHISWQGQNVFQVRFWKIFLISERQRFIDLSRCDTRISFKLISDYTCLWFFHFFFLRSVSIDCAWLKHREEFFQDYCSRDFYQNGRFADLEDWSTVWVNFRTDQK